MGIGRARPGQNIYDTPIGNAEIQNRVLEAAERVLRKRNSRAAPAQPPVRIPTDLVKVKNLTGGPRAAGSVVELGDYLLTSFRRRSLWLEGLVPTTQGVPNVGVLIKALPSTKIGPCQVQGVCLATVNVQHVSDRFCYVQASSHVLKGCAIGHHRILNVPAGTGSQTCVVALGDGVLSCFGLADDAIPSGSSGVVRVYAGTPGAESDTGQTIADCYNYGPAIADEQEVTVSILHGQFYTAALSC